MSEIWYILNHSVTIAWLSLAGLYVYFAVISDLVAMIRGRKKETKPVNRRADPTSQ